MNLFCDLTYGIENNSLGNTLKDYILSLGIISNVIQYISVSSTLMYNWKMYIKFHVICINFVAPCTYSKINSKQEQ